MAIFSDALGAVSHAVRGTGRAVDRAVGGRQTPSDIQAQQANEAAAAQAATNANMTPEQRAEEARRIAMGAGPTYLEKWEQVQPTSYSLGGDPNRANEYADMALATGQNQSQYINQAAAQSQGVGYEMGQQVADIGRGYGEALAGQATLGGQQVSQYGQQAAQNIQNAGQAAQDYGQQQANAMGRQGLAALGYGQGQAGQIGQSASQLGQMGQGVFGQASAAGNRNIVGQQQQALQGLEAQEGPSAARAQLQSGLNASQASNLAMARSGRGWGSSASAMSQAAQQNAAAGQNAANQSAMLRAQESAAFRSRAAQNINAAAQLGLGQANVNDAQQRALIEAGMQGVQAGGQMQAQAAGVGQNAYAQQLAAQQAAASSGQAGIGQNLAAQQAGGQLGLGAVQAGNAMQLGGLEAGGNLAMQGVNAGGQMQLQGIGQSGQLASQAGVLDLSAQQAALAAQQQQVANNMGYQNQMISLHQGNQNVQMNNANNAAQADEAAKGRAAQYFGATMNALGTAAGALSDRDKKKDIQPANRDVLIPATGPVEDIDSMAATQSLLDRGNPYEDPAAIARAQYQFGGGPMPFEQGVGISGPNQAQGAGASEGAAMAASAQAQGQSGDAKQDAAFKKIGGGMKGLGADLMAPVGTGQPRRAPMINLQQTAVPQPMMPQLSDKNEKRNYSLSDEGAKEAVEKAPGYSFEYKDPDAMGATDGMQFGIMAQDLEKTPAGRSVVKKQPDGTRMVDTSRLTMVNTAALNAMAKEIEQLKARAGAR